MKISRQNKIIEIIESNDVKTQEELLELLNDAGFSATQATISRDIRELELTKTRAVGGGYKYARTGEGKAGRHVYTNAAIGTIKSIECAGNIIVTKTYPGLANAVAASIDTLEDAQILGCVAGDDAIITVVRDASYAECAAELIRRLAGRA